MFLFLEELDVKYMIQNDGVTIEHLLREKWQLRKKYVHELRMGKSIMDVDCEPLRWTNELPKGTVLLFNLPRLQSSYFPEDSCELPILFEDDHCLVFESLKECKLIQMSPIIQIHA